MIILWMPLRLFVQVIISFFTESRIFLFEAIFSFKAMSLKEDVVGATFMAAVTSSPELFINFIGTFVTKGDLGVGTVVGSAVFNNLAVPACCGLFAGQVSRCQDQDQLKYLKYCFKVVDLDWWPVSRDCLIYGVAVLSLICVLIDSIVMWYEAFGLVLGYVIYIIGKKKKLFIGMYVDK